MVAHNVPEKGFYHHYKHSGASVGDYAYEVLNIGHHTEIRDPEEGALVVYRPLYRNAFVYKAGRHWDVRPLNMFMETVVKDGRTVPRFSRITDPEVIDALMKIRDEMYGGEPTK